MNQTERYIRSIMHLDGVKGPIPSSPCNNFEDVFPVSRFICGSFGNDNVSDSQKTSDGRSMSTTIVVIQSIIGLSQIIQLAFKNSCIGKCTIATYQMIKESVEDEQSVKNMLEISNATIVFARVVDRSNLNELHIIDLLAKENDSKLFDFCKSYKDIDPILFNSDESNRSMNSYKIQQEMRESNKGILIAIKTSNKGIFSTKCVDEQGEPCGDFDAQFG